MEDNQYLTAEQRAILPYLEAGLSQAAAARRVAVDLGVRFGAQDVTESNTHNPEFKRCVMKIRRRVRRYGNMSEFHKKVILRLMVESNLNQTDAGARVGISPQKFSRLKRLDPDWGAQIDAAKATWVKRGIVEVDDD